MIPKTEKVAVSVEMAREIYAGMCHRRHMLVKSRDLWKETLDMAEKRGANTEIAGEEYGRVVGRLAVVDKAMELFCFGE